ncbi:MAG: toll/interleukin-1 receptor domain-containing protein, partial [Anaerolineales bacterium]|nr:toll/interleukin-1 receptor domain-containing protein [Anaerolineales bacterium]
ILVLSPDAMESRYVREEVNKALELGKTIFPVIYRPAKWASEFETLVREVQTLDLRSGSYTDNFQKLVDGLIEAGAAEVPHERPFLRKPAKVPLGIVFGKIPGWAFAWGLGWLVFWIVGIILLSIITVIQGDGLSDLTSDYPTALFLIFIGAGTGGFTGGLLAGLITMFALRPNAPSISWKHMAPSIRIWAVSGPLGMLVSLLLTFLMVAIGAIGIRTANCEGLGLGECIGAIIGEVAVFLILAISFFLLLAVFTWFLTGVFAGRLAIRHIRRLEPGITSGQSRGVSLGWGCGAIVAVIVMTTVIGFLFSVLGL